MQRIRFAVLMKVAAALLVGSGSAMAMDSADVLPPGVNSPMIRIGYVTGISGEYSSDGNLETLGDVHTIAFNSQQIVNFSPEAKQLVSALNQFGGQNLGSQLNLGYLQFQINPEINYTAPLFARGITDRWTLAIGAPIIHYTNQVSLVQTGSNVGAIQNQIGQETINSNSQLKGAFAKLGSSIVNEAQSQIASLGYAPLGNRDQTFVGDLQVASLYQFYRSENLKMLSKTLFELPTGPNADPNDLEALDLMGRTSVEEQVILNYRLLPPLVLATKVYFHYNVPDYVQKRVPTDADDTLPPPQNEQTVRRKIGDSVGAGVALNYEVVRRFQISTGFEAETKAADSYTGGSTLDYDELSVETNTTFQRIKFGAAYSTVESFMRSESWVPFIVSFEYSDIIAGINMPRETINEIWLTGFF